MAVTLTVNVWSSTPADGEHGPADWIETNPLSRAAPREVEVSGTVQDPGDGQAAVVEDLLLRLALPGGVALGEVDDLESGQGLYAQWEAALTALLARTAWAAATNGMNFRVATLLVDSNAWLHPPLDMSRVCDVSRIEALGVITQAFLVTLGVAPDRWPATRTWRSTTARQWPINTRRLT